MLDDVPITVCSRGRLYTDERQRREIATVDERHGWGTPVAVGVTVVDRSPEWGSTAQMATFETQLGYYGSVRIPAGARDVLGIERGDTVRVTLASLLAEVDSVDVETTVGETA